MKVLNQAASTRCGAGNKEKLSASTRSWLASGFCHDRKSAFRVGLSKQKEMYTSSKVVFSLVLLTLGLIAEVSCVGNEHGRRNDYEGEEGGESADFGGESPHFIHKINK